MLQLFVGRHRDGAIGRFRFDVRNAGIMRYLFYVGPYICDRIDQYLVQKMNIWNGRLPVNRNTAAAAVLRAEKGSTVRKEET